MAGEGLFLYNIVKEEKFMANYPKLPEKKTMQACVHTCTNIRGFNSGYDCLLNLQSNWANFIIYEIFLNALINLLINTRNYLV